MELGAGRTCLYNRVVEDVARGEMDAVWRALELTVDHEVALACSGIVSARDAVAGERLAQNEAEAAA